MLSKVTDDAHCLMNRSVSPCDPAQMLRAALDNGLNARPSYLEVFMPDIMNPQLQSIIAYAHRRLTKENDP
jgi:hypothetical protein